MAHETTRRRKNDAQKEKEQVEPVEEKKSENADTKDEEIKPKYGPHVTFPYQRVWSRCVLILGVMLVVWYNSRNGKEVSLARQKDVLISRSVNVECSDSYETELNKFPGCGPEKCGRVVSDKLVSASETDTLLQLTKNGLKLGDEIPNEGSSILDLQNGVLRKGTKILNIYEHKEAKKVFHSESLAIYKVVKTKIQHAIAHHFGIESSKIYLTKPTFFSRISSIPGKPMQDEHLHPHVIKDKSETFHYTILLYLSDYNRDFEGGRFIFIDKNSVNTTVEPRKGRVSMFTSGSENLYAVERVTSGSYYALRISYTCDKQYAIPDLPNRLLKK